MGSQFDPIRLQFDPTWVKLGPKWAQYIFTNSRSTAQADVMLLCYRVHREFLGSMDLMEGDSEAVRL